MRKIFVFWIVFLIALVIGIGLAIYSKSILMREEETSEKLKESVISRPSRLPKAPEALEAPIPVAVEPQLPPLENIPVQVNTDSLEISIPSSSDGLPSLPQNEEEPAQ